jgi:hydrogenase expression/formation protein HypE
MVERDEIITLAHGGGGARTADLIRSVFAPALDNPILREFDDAACVALESRDVAVTTDSYVVQPLFFPGGDIGRLAVCGTVNDLAMQGARPVYLTAGFILEEGLAVSDLRKILASMASAAREAGVQVVAGDTKVVERSAGWGMFINTSGIGLRKPAVNTRVKNAKAGDVVLISGALGNHTVAVMSRRHGIAFETSIQSDVAPLNVMIQRLLDSVPGVHALRDPTRGGLAAALNDIAATAGVAIRIWEREIPINREVRGACDLLGIDPIAAANEGKAVVICAPESAEQALAVLRADPYGREARIIGKVVAEPAGRVLLETFLGGERLVDVPLGEDLPRIC